MVIDDFVYQLKKNLALPLPGKKSHQKMLAPGRELRDVPDNGEVVKKSSVLIILYPDNGKLFCILIKRPSTMKFHAAQIALPGGMIENHDTGPLQAALREAREEVGIDPLLVEIIGELTMLYISVSGFSITPFVGWCKSDPQLNHNPYEVDKVVRFPLSDFMEENNLHYFEAETSAGRLNVPCFFYQGEAIWGATAMILSELLDILRELTVIKGITFE